MISIIKQDPQGKEKIRYQGEFLERLPTGVVIQAKWMLPTKDLGYTCFEQGDIFTEYYYSDRWFNIFDILDVNGKRKGWYCNVAQPAVIFDDRIEQIDLLLDIWVAPQGKPLVLDEDEFAAATTLSEEQRKGAREGLRALLQLLATHSEVFAPLEF
jgi:predicted RNA-binding protein associated with RNAse of E/G family